MYENIIKIELKLKTRKRFIFGSGLIREKLSQNSNFINVNSDMGKGSLFGVVVLDDGRGSIVDGMVGKLLWKDDLGGGLHVLSR